MPHAAEKGRGRPSLDDLAMPHHGDAVRHRADHAKIVQISSRPACVLLATRSRSKVEDLRLRA